MELSAQIRRKRIGRQKLVLSGESTMAGT